MDRIHILGLGNIGTFLAHSLRTLPTPPPITLLLRPTTLPSFLTNPSITVHDAATSTSTTTTNYDAAPSHLPPPGGIRTLIVTTKSHHTRAALLPLSPALTASSTVLLLQNGMPPSAAELFPSVPAEERPRVTHGVVTHGVFGGGFRITLAGRGKVLVGEDVGLQEVVEVVGWEEMERVRLRKLAVNVAVNALTAIHGVRNGELFGVPGVEGVMREAVREVVEVVGGGEEELWGAVEEVVEVTKGNWSSMVQDLRAGRRTEVAEINGWVVRRGRERGVVCRVNEELVRRVRELEGLRPEA